MQMVQRAGPGVPLDTLCRVQGHVLSPTTRQEIHLITCEAEDGCGGLTVFPEHSARDAKRGREEGGWARGGEGHTVKRAREGREKTSWIFGYFLNSSKVFASKLN